MWNKSSGKVFRRGVSSAKRTRCLASRIGGYYGNRCTLQSLQRKSSGIPDYGKRPFGIFCVHCGWWGFDPLRMDSPPTDDIRSTFARKRATTLPIFTLEVNGRPTLVFETAGPAEACEICLDTDLRSDLSALTSDGIPICSDGAILSSRPAVQEEIAAYKHAVRAAPASDEPTMAFLIKIDGVFVVAVGPQ